MKTIEQRSIPKIKTYLTLLALATGLLTFTAQIAAQQRGVRVNDRQVERIIRNIEQKSDIFRRSFDPALDRSRLDGTYTEDQINQYVKSFEDATNDLRSRFNGRTAVASDVENVLNRAAVIDKFMRTNLPQRQVQANWTSLRRDLSRLASAYNVTFDWNGLYLTPTVVAAYRVTDRQVQTLLDRIETRGDLFRTSLDRALDRSRYNETNREENVNEFVKDFENSTDELRRKFDGRTSVDLDVSNVVVRAARIDDFMVRNLRRETAVQRNWRNLRADLKQLSSYYGLAFNLDSRRGMPAYGPLAVMTSNDRFTGTYRLDTLRSENARTIAERNTSGLNANARTRIITNLSRRLNAPEMLAIQREGTRVFLATSTSPQIMLDADGRLRNERYPNGRPSNVLASFTGDSLTVVSNGDRANDFTAKFTSIDGGRGMLVTRRVYVEQLREPVEVRSYYDRTAESAQFNVYNTTNGTGYVNTGYPNTFIVPRDVSLVAALDRDLSTETTRDGDRFTMTVTSPSRYAGAVIEGYVLNVNRSGRVTGRSGLSLVYDTIRMNNQTYRFAGITETVRNTAGERVQIDNEGMVEDRSSQTSQTIGRTAIGAGVGALLGAIFGGGEGAAVGAAVGVGAGVGSIFVQGRDNLELRNGAEFTIRSTAPLS